MLDELWVEEGEPGKLILQNKECNLYCRKNIQVLIHINILTATTIRLYHINNMNNINMNNNNKQLMLSTSTWSRFIMKSLSVGVNSVPSLVNCRSKFDTSFRWRYGWNWVKTNSYSFYFADNQGLMLMMIVILVNVQHWTLKEQQEEPSFNWRVVVHYTSAFG